MAAPSLRPYRIRTGPGRRSGYTLVELLVGAISMSVLMIGMASAVVLATRALDDGTHPATKLHESAMAADEIARDVGSALTFSERTATALTMTVSDRTGDAQPETIRYAWSGTLGDPLTRRINDGETVVILQDVRELELDYDLRGAGVGDTPEPNEGAETLLIGYDAVQDLDDFLIVSASWVGQYFKPNLPENAISWSVTRVSFRARVEGAALGHVWAQLREATLGGLPTGTVLEQVELLEIRFWYDYDPASQAEYSSVTDLSPSDGLCFVLEHRFNPCSGSIQYHTDASPSLDTHLVQTTDGGSSWTAPSSQCLRFSVYGTITSVGEPEIVGIARLKCVHIKLRAGEDTSTRIDTAVRVLNDVEVTE